MVDKDLTQKYFCIANDGGGCLFKLMCGPHKNETNSSEIPICRTGARLLANLAEDYYPKMSYTIEPSSDSPEIRLNLIKEPSKEIMAFIENGEIKRRIIFNYFA